MAALSRPLQLGWAAAGAWCFLFLVLNSRSSRPDIHGLPQRTTLAAAAHAAAAVACLNATGLPERPATYSAHKASGEVARLLPLELWHSAKRVLEQPLTVVTALTRARLPMLAAQCASWPGPLAAVLYVPLVAPPANSSSSSTTTTSSSSTTTTSTSSTSSQARRLSALSEQAGAEVAKTRHEAASLFERLEVLPPGGGSCALTLLLVTELVAADLAEQLPINSLRNAALLLASTPLVAVLDVDMLVSSSLAAALAQPAHAQVLLQLCEAQQAAVVLPAFETIPYKAVGLPVVDTTTLKVADFARRADKAALQGLLATRLLQPFNLAVNPPGQAETDYARWLSLPAGSGAAVAYRISPAHRKFEPWYVLSRRGALSLPYDERFRGYGKNKIAHLTWLRALGRPLHVHAAGFLVHRVHADSGAKDAWLAQQRGPVGKPGREPFNTRQMAELEAQLGRGRYAPALGGATRACLTEQLAELRVP